MCVIAVCATERVSPEQVAKMYVDNPHGAGVAWREERAAGRKEPAKTVVVWRKGLEEEETQELCAKLPLPFVVHFRVPSCGGPSNLLTHPFPIEKDVPLQLEGTTTGQVLFHNGHWHKYKDTILEASIRGGWKIPTGRWSDSRAMALLAANQGVGVLEFLNEKVVVFGPEVGDIELFGENGWSKVGNGIWVSNRGWEHRQVKGFPKASSPTDKKDEQGAGDNDKEGPPAGGGSKMKVVSGSGKKDEPAAGNGGALLKGRPFDSYMAAMRLWKEGHISNNGFKKERRKYEQWCRKMKTQPLPRPPKWVRQGEIVH